MSVIRRGFVEIAEGQVHYRHAGAEHAGVPLVLLHASPGSSRMLEPLLAGFAPARRVLAPDTLGNGDSAPPPGEQPEIPVFADAHLRALAALDVARFDLYGTHTGAAIAIEMALAAPGRVRRLILDGVSLYPDALRDDILAHYAPEVRPDLHGGQLNWVWHFVRDTSLFWPWYRRDAAHRRAGGLPSADELHDKVVEVLKALGTYRLSYSAAFRYEKRDRLPLLAVPTLLACARSDMLYQFFDAVRALAPQAEAVVTPGQADPGARAATLALFNEFLGRG